jgi:regulator of protease activity HflC (stomatin/prohibitin superfamily)
MADATPFVRALPEPQVRERRAQALPGLAVLAASIALTGVGLWQTLAATQATASVAVHIALATLAFVAAGLGFSGLTVVAPREARVLQFLGRYVGTLRDDGLRFVNPFTTRKKVSTRIRNHETSTLKVNDADGNPIEIAAVVVWQVADTARATFEVDDFVEYVSIQAETAVRHVANSFPYDAHGADQLSLRDDADEITERLSAEVSARVEAAGVTIIESRITHLAYAQEITQAMLQRQQASAVVAARQLIVEGAVGMVETALERLQERDVVVLDDERKAAMVSNLLVVLCGHQATQPVVNAGSLYT